ncbi:MAG: hypothetical protein AAGE05_02475 [Pseudomonadota bacterium]
MTAQNRIDGAEVFTPEIDQIPQLYAVLGIIEQIAPAHAESIAIPSEADLRQAYDRTSGIAKKGFGATAGEAVDAATIGAHALLGKSENASAAAEVLAHHLRGQIVLLGRFVGL